MFLFLRKSVGPDYLLMASYPRRGVPNENLMEAGAKRLIAS